MGGSGIKPPQAIVPPSTQNEADTSTTSPTASLSNGPSAAPLPSQTKPTAITPPINRLKRPAGIPTRVARKKNSEEVQEAPPITNGEELKNPAKTPTSSTSVGSSLPGVRSGGILRSGMQPPSSTASPRSIASPSGSQPTSKLHTPSGLQAHSSSSTTIGIRAPSGLQAPSATRSPNKALTVTQSPNRIQPPIANGVITPCGILPPSGSNGQLNLQRRNSSPKTSHLVRPSQLSSTSHGDGNNSSTSSGGKTPPGVSNSEESAKLDAATNNKTVEKDKLPEQISKATHQSAIPSPERSRRIPALGKDQSNLTNSQISPAGSPKMKTKTGGSTELGKREKDNSPTLSKLAPHHKLALTKSWSSGDELDSPSFQDGLTVIAEEPSQGAMNETVLEVSKLYSTALQSSSTESSPSRQMHQIPRPIDVADGSSSPSEDDCLSDSGSSSETDAAVHAKVEGSEMRIVAGKSEGSLCDESPSPAVTPHTHDSSPAPQLQGIAETLPTRDTALRISCRRFGSSAPRGGSKPSIAGGAMTMRSVTSVSSQRPNLSSQHTVSSAIISDSLDVTSFNPEVKSKSESVADGPVPSPLPVSGMTSPDWLGVNSAKISQLLTGSTLGDIDHLSQPSLSDVAEESSLGEDLFTSLDYRHGDAKDHGDTPQVDSSSDELLLPRQRPRAQTMPNNPSSTAAAAHYALRKTSDPADGSLSDSGAPAKKTSVEAHYRAAKQSVDSPELGISVPSHSVPVTRVSSPLVPMRTRTVGEPIDVQTFGTNKQIERVRSDTSSATASSSAPVSPSTDRRRIDVPFPGQSPLSSGSSKRSLVDQVRE